MCVLLSMVPMVGVGLSGKRVFGAARTPGRFHQQVQTRRVQVTSALPAPYQLDGDSGGELPLEAKITARMTLVISAKWLEQANDPRLTSPQPSL